MPLAAGGGDAVGSSMNNGASIGAVSGTCSTFHTNAAAAAPAQASHQSADDDNTNNSNSGNTRQECRWYPTLSELAEEMTNRLRACPDLVDSGTNNNNTASGDGGASSASASASASALALGYGGLAAIPTDPMLLLGGGGAGGGSGMLEIGGTYAALTWIDLDEAAMRGRDDDIDAMDITTTSGGSPATGGGASGQRGGAGRKRSRRSSCGSRGRGADSTSQKHLHVEVRINDEPAGQILLCSAEVATSTTATAAAKATSSTTLASASAAAAAANDPAFLSPIHSQYYSNHEPIHVQSFSYLLLRGKMKAIQPVLLYLESTLGCAIGARPFTPSPADVAASLSNWMAGTVVEQRRQRRRLVAEYRGRKSIGSGGNGGNGMDDDIVGIGGMGSIAPGGSTVASKKPLELTLAIPPHLVRAGLERITVTVPPVSLTRLCSAVVRKRPLPSSTPIVGKGGSRSSGAITPLMVTDSEKDDESSGYRPGSGVAVGTEAETAAAAASNTNGSPSGTDQQPKSPDNYDQPTEQVDHDEDLPILRALQCYLYEAFHIDARQLHVVKAATAHAVVGTDGRIKPLTVEALPTLLDDIGMMIRRATGARTESVGSVGAEADES